MKITYIVSIIAVLIISLISYKLASNKKELDKKNKPAPVVNSSIPVKVAEAKEQLREISIVKTGNLTPFKEVKALAAASGTLQQLRFNLGDHVNKGQVLAVTDTRTPQLELQKARTSVEKLKNDLEVYTQLLQGKAATQEKVNEVRQNYLDAVNQVDQARKNLSDASILAPSSGTISAKPVEQGVWVNAGTEVATIVNLSRAKVQVNLTEAEVYQVSHGQKVKITTDVYPGVVFNGTVSFVSPQADEVHNYLSEIFVDNSDKSFLRSGTFVYADFSKTTKQQVILIPREAVMQSIKNASVFVVENNVVHQREIRTGAETGNMIQVTSGLRAGERVVASGQINLKEGSPVSISK
jgi:membrane fusion protein (multidrug efflux system)